MPSPHYTVIFPDGYEEFEGLTEAKDCVTASITTDAKKTYLIYFVTPARAAQDADDELARRPAHFEQNLVFVKATDRDSILAAAEFLIQSGALNGMHELTTPVDD